jgi:RNA polymerase sigma-70 factor, ECF subfamily
MDAAESPFAEALHSAQNGDEAAFRMVYRELQPRLLRYLRVIVGEEADDVASEAWLQIARDLGTFRGDWDAFRGWAVTIARHRAMDHLRATRRRPSVAVPVDLFTDLADGQDTATEAMDAVSTEAAIALIATLPRDQAEAVLLRAVMGLDAQAAGKVLGKRAGAVRTAAYRGLRRLAQDVGPTGLPPPRVVPRPFRQATTS